MDNPFVYEGFALDTKFCGREEEIIYLDQVVKYSNNLVLFSKRRMGKSSLIQEFIQNRVDRNKYICIYVDLFEISSKLDFIRLITKCTANSLPFNMKNGLEQLVKIFKTISFSVDVDSISGSIGFNPKINSLDFDDACDDYFQSLNRYIKGSNKKAIVVFDEFQQVVNIKDKNIDAIIRKHIQSHENISYIFSGSKKNLLTSLFSNAKAPLYQMATFKELEPIKEEDFFRFANKHLHYSIQEEIFSYIYRVCGEESKLIQEVLFHIYKDNIQHISQDVCDKIIGNIIDEKASSFRLIYDMLSNTKKSALKILSKTNNIYSQEILMRYDISKPALQSALKKLVSEEELIEQKDNKYLFDNKLFELWCRKL
jgi:AAA+ ATPase superfamily predicted ATPase